MVKVKFQSQWSQNCFLVFMIFIVAKQILGGNLVFGSNMEETNKLNGFGRTLEIKIAFLFSAK